MIRSTSKATYEAATPAAVESAEPRPIIVEITGDIITFRHKKSRRRYTITIADAFREAMLRTS